MTGDLGWPGVLALTAVSVFVVSGIQLLLPLSDSPDRRSDFGIALFTGALLLLIGVGVNLVLSEQADKEQRDRAQADAEAAHEREVAAASSSSVAAEEDRLDRERQLAVTLIESGSPLDGLDLTGKPFYGLSIVGRSLADATLDEAILSGTDLRGSDLSGASLIGADLSGAVLVGAQLDGAVIGSAQGDSEQTSMKSIVAGRTADDSVAPFSARHATFDNVDLGLADLRGAVLIDSSFVESDLTGVDLRGAYLIGARIENATMSGADLSHALLTGARLTGSFAGAILVGADLTGADLRGADLRDAVLDGAVLRGAIVDRTTSPTLAGTLTVRASANGVDLESTGIHLAGADLRGADLSAANLSGVDLTGADLTDADLRGADLRGANLTGAVLSGATLRGADLTDAVLTGAIFERANLSEARLERVDAQAASFDDAQMVGTLMTFSASNPSPSISADGAIVNSTTSLPPDVNGTVSIDASELADLSLRGANLTGLDLRGRTFRNVDMSDAILTGADLSRARVFDSQLDNVFAVNLTAEYIELGGVSAIGADIRFSDLSRSLVYDTKFVDAYLYGTDFNSTSLGADLTGADLSSSSLQSTVFTSATLTDSTTFTDALTDSGTWWGEAEPPGVVQIGPSTRLAGRVDQTAWLDDGTESVIVTDSSVEVIGAASSGTVPSMSVEGSRLTMWGDPAFSSLEIRNSSIYGSAFEDGRFGSLVLSMADGRGIRFSESVLAHASIDHLVIDSTTVLPDGFEPTGDQVVDLSEVLIEERLTGLYLGREFSQLGADPLRCVRCDLTSSNLHAAPLQGTLLLGSDLRWSQLRGAHLARANLTGANLTGASAERAELQDAILASASLRDTELRGANLSYADLSGADLRGADLTGANVLYADMEGAIFDRSTRLPAYLDPHQAGMIDVAAPVGATSSTGRSRAVRISGMSPVWPAFTTGRVDLRGAYLIREDVTDAQWNGSDLDSTSIYSSNVNAVDLSQSSAAGLFTSFSLFGSVSFEDAILWRSTFDNVSIVDSSFAGADLTGAEFSEAVLVGVDFRGALLEGTTFTDVLADPSTKWTDDVVPPGVTLDAASYIARLSDRGGRFLTGIDLTGLDLDGAQLAGVLMSDAVLVDAHLEGANLRRASLRGANLSGALLARADLRGADLRGALLLGADLTDADLTGALVDSETKFDLNSGVLNLGRVSPSSWRGFVLFRLEHLRQDALTLVGLDLTSAVFTDLTATSVDANGISCLQCMFRAMSVETTFDLAYTDLSSSLFLDVTVPRLVLEGATLDNAAFENLDVESISADSLVAPGLRMVGVSSSSPSNFYLAQLPYADIRNCRLDGSFFVQADLPSADLRGCSLGSADLTLVDLTNADLRGVDLTGSDLTDAFLDGAIYDAFTIWPEGFEIPSEAFDDVARWDIAAPEFMDFLQQARA